MLLLSYFQGCPYKQRHSLLQNIQLSKFFIESALVISEISLLDYIYSILVF